MESEVLIQRDAYTVTRERGVSDEIKDFLDDITWGTSETLYERQLASERIPHLSDPNLLVLRKGSQILGTALFCHTMVGVGANMFNAYYIRYLASSPAIRGNAIFGRFSRDLMTLLREHETFPTLFYAFIETKNSRSFKLVSSVGYTKVGAMGSVGFSRFFPKKDIRLERIIQTEDKQKVIQLLEKQYQNHILRQFDSINQLNNYYVLRENGEIVAGVQVHEVVWVIRKMAGAMGWFAINLVPYIPFLNKLFNPNAFKFLAFEGVYYQTGREKELTILFESLLAKFKLNSALLWVDELDLEKYNHLDLGLLNHFVKGTGSYTMVSGKNLPDGFIESLKNRPAYISSFDFV